MTKRDVRRPQHKRVLTPPPPMMYVICLLLFCPLLKATTSAAEDMNVPNAKREQAREGHVFTEEDLVFDTVFMEEPGAAPKTFQHPISLTATFATDDLSQRFSHFYEPALVSLETRKSGYPLPIDEDQIVNLNQVLDQTNLNYYGRQKLLEQGFLSVNFGEHDDFLQAYRRIRNRRLPPFITSTPCCISISSTSRQRWATSKNLPWLQISKT